jgi:hypothetical protein
MLLETGKIVLSEGFHFFLLKVFLSFPVSVSIRVALGYSPLQHPRRAFQ